MEINKNMKRLLSLALVCLMLTPIISFADPEDNADETATDISTEETTDDAADTVVSADTDTDWIDLLNSTASAAATVDSDAVLAEKEFLKLPYLERQAISAEAGIVETSKEDIEGHSYVCSRGGYELYLKKDTLSILIRNEETGAIIRSTLSAEQAVARGYTQTMFDTVTTGVCVTPITYDATSTQRFGQFNDGIMQNLLSDSKSSVSYDDIKEGSDVIGFVAHVNFATYGFQFDIEVYLLEEGGLTYTVPDASVVESNESYRLSVLQVFPLLGWTDRGDRSGYMIFPDGNGIQINYDDYLPEGTPKYKSQYIKPVYGTDFGVNDLIGVDSGSVGTSITEARDFTNAAETVGAPYFGMVYDDTRIAMVGIVEEGEYGAYIQGNINGYNRCFENYVTAYFQYRTTYVEYTDSTGTSERLQTTDERMIADVKTTYLFTSGDEASYSGLANKLREYLLETGTLTEAEDDQFGVRLDFLGVDKENFLVFRRNVVATTASDIEDIVKELSAQGVDNILAIFEGWQEDGVYALPISDFDADRDVGGNSGIISLYETMKDGNYGELYLIQDMAAINTSLNSSVFTSITCYTGKTYEMNERFNEVFKTFRYLYPEKSESYIKELASDFIDEDIMNIGLKGMTNLLYAYQKSKVNYTRLDSINYYTSALAYLKEKGMNVALEQPFMYQWKYADTYLDLTVGSSMYVYASNEIPFLSMVLSGTMRVYSEYINFEANSTEYFLKLVETGVYPSFLITKESPAVMEYTNSNWNYSSEYEKYEETIVEYYTKLKEINDKVNGEHIVNHEKLDSNVSITTYSNGVKVYVNFSDTDVTVDGVTIEAESYVVR